MDELLKELQEVLGICHEEHIKVDEEKMKEYVRKDLENFHSLVSDGEHKAVRNLETALKDLLEVHVSNIDSFKDRDITTQQAVHYDMFIDFIKNAAEVISCLSTIDTIGAQTLAEVRVKEGITYDKMLKVKLFKGMLDSE